LNKLRAIRNYQYSVNVLSRDLNYEEVAEIFVRVNSLGVKLRGSDLALAQITARWPNSLALFEEFQDECEENYMTLDLGLLVRSMVVMATNQSRFMRVANTSTVDLKKGWDDAKAGTRYAVNFLKTQVGIEDETLLSSPMFFISLAYLSRLKHEQFSQDEIKQLKYWVLVASAKGRYSRGSSESLLDADLRAMERQGGVQGLLDNLVQQFGRLNFEPQDFAGRSSNSPLFSLLFLALRANNATDWSTGLGISLSLQGRQHKIQYHHIFPKALLKHSYDRGMINEMANLAFVSGRTNQRIGAKPPRDYLPSIIEKSGAETLIRQGVPLDKALFELEAFPKFIEARRQILADIVNRFISELN
jgi:hypothetical protein